MESVISGLTGLEWTDMTFEPMAKAKRPSSHCARQANVFYLMCMHHASALRLALLCVF